MSMVTDTIEQVLTFNAGGETFTLPARDIVEVIRPRACTRVPNTPGSLLGVCNHRGDALSVISLRRMMGISDTASTPAERVIVIDQGQTLGLLVDAITTLAAADSARPIDLNALLAREFDGLVRRSARGQSRVVAVPEPSSAPIDTAKLLCFAVAGQDFALAATDVEGVRKLPADIIAVPGTDEVMLGVMEMRDALIPLVSLRRLLGLGSEASPAGTAWVIVTRIGANLVGLVGDEVQAVLTVPLSSIDAVPTVLTRGAGEAQIESICRMEGGRLVSVLARDRLFDEQTVARISREVSARIEMPTAGPAMKSMDEKFLIFDLGDETYGLPIASVDRIVRYPDRLTRVPRAPDYVRGLMSIQGKVVPIIDQGARFAIAQGQARQNQKVIVLTIEGQQAGFVVDNVSEIIAIPQAELKSAPNYNDRDDGEARVVDRLAVHDRDGRVLILLSAKGLLDGAERDILARLAAEEGESTP